jgi:large subunit ribosomal protein L1
MKKEEIIKALEELRKQEKRKFEQSVDLIVNLKSFDIKREIVNIIVTIPHKFKEIKAAAFLTKKSNIIDTIVKEEFGNYKGKKMKNLVKNYDFFIAHASLMPAIATNFGKFLGPTGKMPSPALGIITKEDDAEIKAVLDKASRAIKIKTKEPSIKLNVGKENMKDEDIAENILIIFNALLNALPRKNENLKSIMIKFTMSKPIKIQLK